MLRVDRKGKVDGRGERMEGRYVYGEGKKKRRKEYRGEIEDRRRVRTGEEK